MVEQEDEIQRLCIQARTLRLQAATAAARRMLALCQLRETLWERKRLLMWSRKLSGSIRTDGTGNLVPEDQ